MNPSRGPLGPEAGSSLQIHSTGRRLTRSRYGLGSFDAILDHLQKRMDAFDNSHGLSSVDDFWKRLTTSDSPAEVATSVLNDVIEKFTLEDVAILVQRGREKYAEDEPHSANDEESSVDWPVPRVNPHDYGALLESLFQGLLRASENGVRDEAGVPGIGLVPHW